MGHLKIEQIRPTHLLEFYTNLQEDGIRADGKPGKLSEKTVLYHHRILSSIFNDAIQWQVLASNPASRVKPPKVIKKQASCYDEKQTVILIDAIEKEELKYKAIITLALFTGLRRGELMGLEWQDIDFNRGIMEVRQASQYIPGQGTFTKEPKNETSKRIMAIPASVLNLLKQYKAHQAEERLKVGSLWRGSGVLSDFTEVFDAVTPKEISGAQFLKSLIKQKNVTEKWEENLQAIADKINNEEFIQELRKFGEKAAPEIAALNTLTDEQLKEYITLCQRKKKLERRQVVHNMGRTAHAPGYFSSWFPKFIRTYNIREAFNAEISAVSNKLSAQDLENLEALKEQYIKLSRTNFKAAKGKLTAVEDSITAIIGQEGLKRIQQGQMLPPLPFHGLRHTAATMLINQGLPAKSISGRLGHADIGTTYNIYGHYLKSADKEAADSLERVYQNMTGNGKNDTTKEQA
jgi:integrase